MELNQEAVQEKTTSSSSVTFDINLQKLIAAGGASSAASKKPLRCPICSWKIKTNWESHLQSHMEEKPYKCTLSNCNFASKHRQNLIRHVTTHSKGKQFACDICLDYRATTKYTVQKHKQNCHNISTSNTPSTVHSPTCRLSKVNLLGSASSSQNQGRRGHFNSCTCKSGKKSKGKKSMDLNQRRNHNEPQPLAQNLGKPLRCPVCSWKINSSNFERHLQSHMEQKPFKCAYASCTFSTRHKQNLDRHEIVHTKEKRYSCEMCEYRATTRYTVVKHMRSCHQVDTPTTPNAHNVASSSSGGHHHNKAGGGHHHTSNNLSRLHSEERSFKCPLCKYKGKSQDHLSRHLSMKAHNNIPTPLDKNLPPHPQTGGAGGSNNNNLVNQAVVNSIGGIGRGALGGVDAGTFAGFSTAAAAATLCNPYNYYPYGLGVGNTIGKPYG